VPKLWFQFREAERVVAEYTQQIRIWLNGADAKFGRESETVDIGNSAQVAELLRIPNIKMLEKKRLREAVVDALQLELRDLRRDIAARERDEHQKGP
jgi:hypothetical protein